MSDVMRVHECDSGNFDRTICPEPCGAMHSYCDTCGERQDACAQEYGRRKPTTEEAEAILTLVRGGWLRLELSIEGDR